jgi:hypothetical protein
VFLPDLLSKGCNLDTPRSGNVAGKADTPANAATPMAPHGWCAGPAFIEREDRATVHRSAEVS